MSGLYKLGYFLLGLGSGMLASSYIYDWSRTAPIGEDEEYIPEDEKDSNDNRDNSSDKEDSENDIQDDRPHDSDSEKVLLKKKPNTHRVRYDKMFDADIVDDSKGYSEDPRMKDLDEDEKAYLEYITQPPDDEPEDDDVYDDNDDYIRERVEENIEIYLQGNPPDIVSLNWYNGDKTLTDDRDEIIPNWEDIVGSAAIHRLAERGPGAENGVINIRNLKTCIDYEVVFLESKYQETVLGIFESRLKRDGQRNETP